MGKGLQYTFLQIRYAVSSTRLWKHVQNYQSPEKCKAKPQWDTTSYPLGWVVLNKGRNNECR